MNIFQINVMINEVLWWALICMLVLEAYNLIFHRGLPNIQTSPALCKKTIELLKKHFAENGIKNPTIIDLGSGSGRYTREMAKAFPDANIIGVEIAESSLKIANAFKHKHKLENLSYEKADFFEYNFAKADVVVFYLLPSLMKRLSEKFDKELKPGAVVVSNKFPIKNGWEPEMEMKVKTLYFHQGMLYFYRKK